MKPITLLAAFAVAIVAAPAAAKPDHAKGHGAGHGASHPGVGKTGCPPGLAKKRNGCLPPGQARKYARGDRLPAHLSRYNLPGAYRDRYRDNRSYMYRYEDRTIYRVNRRSGLIDAVISAIR
jgi:hypothetical protein